MNKIRIGTRTSALAMAQTHMVVDLLKQADPSLVIEVIGVKNVTGDVDKTTALANMGTIGVFTKEIDEMVLNDTVDCAVHSLKDIGTQRPGDLRTIAIPKRAQPHDIVLFRPDIMDIIKSGRPIILGASSPRRMALTPPFLKKALPQLNDKSPEIIVKPIRGNVPSRIAKLRGEKQAEHDFDGVILAYAGVSRLYKDVDANPIIAPLLKDLKIMVLPITECPGAPGQGALAVEARSSNEKIVTLLNKINDRKAQGQINLERNILIENGGGCHQSFGVTCLKLDHCDDKLLIVRGTNKDGVDISETRNAMPDLDPHAKIWNGLDWRQSSFATDLLEHPPIDGDAVFVSHSRAVEACETEDFHTKRIWTAGVTSWERMAKKGLWVEGCADGFGYDYLIKTLLTDAMLELPTCTNWNILTHKDATDKWTNKGDVVPTYAVVKQDDDTYQDAITAIKKADHIYWSSYSQYQTLKDHAPINAIHMCGPGKTAELLKQEKLDKLIIVPYFNQG